MNGIASSARTQIRRRGLPRRYGAAFTLLEVVAVAVLLGVLALAAAGAFRPQTIGDLEGRITAERIAWDLRQARRRAISHGDNHAVVFASSGGHIVGYALHRRLPSNALAAVDESIPLPPYVSITSSSPEPEFTFEGAALAGYVITIAAPHRNWTITVAQATGAVQVQ